MEKKYLIPTVIGVLLLCGIVFTLVYKKTDGNIKEKVEVQTLETKETKPIENIVVGGDSSLEDFDINKTEPIETKVAYIDEEGNLLSDKEAKAIEESEIESIAQLAEQASISAQSINEEDYKVDESKEAESFSQEEFSDFQSGVSMKISELTAQEALADMRVALKSEVEKYAPEHPELQGITPEMIDNYSEEELYSLYGKICDIIGY